ncbi:MAG: histidine kinase [Vicinamibacteraceae bacterium]
MQLTRCHPVVGLGLFALFTFALLAEPMAQRDAPEANRFGGLAGGPYERLVIQNAKVIPGHGGPPAGPYDIVIEGDTITEMRAFDPVTAERRGKAERPTGDRVIDATGMYVMPGMIDLHMHLRTEPMPLEYVYYLKLAHGVTSLVPAPDRGLDAAMEQARRSAENEILAPRMYPIWNWGNLDGYTREELEDPAQAPRIAKAIAAKGMRVVSVGSVAWRPELFGAVCKAVRAAGGITTVHLPPSTNAVVDAVDAAQLGVTMIEHHYGYAEASLDRTTQDFPREYDFNDEAERFRHAGKVWVDANRERLLTDVAQALADSGVAMLPTRVVYEANRDILRAQALPWHEKYTHLYTLFVSGVWLFDRLAAEREAALQAAQLESQLRQAQLQGLRLQLQPHFLFNALNTISSTMYDDPRAADTMLSRLAELLRVSLKTTQTQEVPLATEIESLEHYIALLRARFGDRLLLQIDVEDGLRHALAPSLILQPLIENAVRHGNLSRVGTGRIAVRACAVGERMRVEVEDDGQGPEDAVDVTSKGLGIPATVQRLRLLYGAAQRFELAKVPGTGFVVRMEWPRRDADPARVIASQTQTSSSDPEELADAHAHRR